MKPLLISSGEPAGVGPDLCLGLADSPYPLVVLADKALLNQRADQLQMAVTIKDYVPGLQSHKEPATLSVIQVPQVEKTITGVLCSRNAAYVMKMLTMAVDLCLQGEFCALVTAPVHKAVINQAGIPFSGHTEFLAQRCGRAKVVMMLACKEMRVALVTTHLPLKNVSQALTRDTLRQSLIILHSALREQFGVAQPTIYVSGMNPHAGENGYLGLEEIAMITPVLNECRAMGMQVQGPFPADTMFSVDNNQKCDAYLVMYHDQGLPVIKYASFGRAANITLGLPIIRTSVDHGTALELAGKNKAHSGSMAYAVQEAWRMAGNSL